MLLNLDYKLIIKLFRVEVNIRGVKKLIYLRDKIINRI